MHLRMREFNQLKLYQQTPSAIKFCYQFRKVIKVRHLKFQWVTTSQISVNTLRIRSETKFKNVNVKHEFQQSINVPILKVFIRSQAFPLLSVEKQKQASSLQGRNLLLFISFISFKSSFTVTSISSKQKLVSNLEMGFKKGKGLN